MFEIITRKAGMKILAWRKVDSDPDVLGTKARDCMPRIWQVFIGKMSFVGTRPEVVKYVERYTPEMMATLLMPAGITSLTSIMYKDEEKLLASTDDADSVYLSKVLPEKMKYNLEYVANFSFFHDIGLMFKTVKEVF